MLVHVFIEWVKINLAKRVKLSVALRPYNGREVRVEIRVVLLGIYLEDPIPHCGTLRLVVTVEALALEELLNVGPGIGKFRKELICHRSENRIAFEKDPKLLQRNKKLVVVRSVQSPNTFLKFVPNVL